MIKRALVVVLGLAALILNPFFGCGERARDFSYGASEMRVAIEGTWKLTLPATDKEPAREIVMSISQAAESTHEKHSRARGFITDAAACTQRSLVKSAGACMDMSEMPLELETIAGDLPSDEGLFRVPGLTFTSGHLSFGLGTWRLTARVSPRGQITEIYANNYEAKGASMVRMSTAQR